MNRRKEGGKGIVADGMEAKVRACEREGMGVTLQGQEGSMEGTKGRKDERKERQEGVRRYGRESGGWRERRKWKRLDGRKGRKDGRKDGTKGGRMGE